MENLVDEFLKSEYFHMIEMVKVGQFGKYTIQIYSNEGPVPHFHFINSEVKIEGCICIMEARYFNHGIKQAILSSKDRKV